MSKLVTSLLGLSLLLAVCALADDRAEGARARLAFMRSSADEYHFQAVGSDKVANDTRTGEKTAKDDKTKITRIAEPILRWDNRVIREDDAALFVWVQGKRPVCAAQFFLAGDVWHHEFQSMTEQRFQVTWRGADWKWSSEEPGLKFERADLEAPAAKGPLRLRQMRSFAERFAATIDASGAGGAKSGVKELYALRLLSTPVYRYSDEPDLLDGAIFVFAQGTNPEVLLLIEAVRADGGSHWQYGFAPMTSFEAEVKRGEKIVWKKDLVEVPMRDRKGPYQFRYRVLPWNESTGEASKQREAKEP